MVRHYEVSCKSLLTASPYVKYYRDMKPFTQSILSDVTPMFDLSPIGPFGVLIQMSSGVYGLEVLPYRGQWSMDIVTEARA
jgi:hypothetical protein